MIARLLCLLGLHRWFDSTSVVKVSGYYTVKEIRRCAWCEKEKYVK